VGYSKLLFLHVLAAFTVVTGVGMQVAIGLALRKPAYSQVALRLAPAARVLSAVGGLSVIIFGIWLAIHDSQYSLTDGWILAAIVLWVIAAGVGGRLGAMHERLGRADGAAPPPLVMHAVLVVTVLALLLDMIYKPGAS
jgi:hypothetical protein